MPERDDSDLPEVIDLDDYPLDIGDPVPAPRLFESPQLGLATNEQMLRELICRFKMIQFERSAPVASVHLSFERALVLAEMLGAMSAPEREYRTVGHG